MPPDLGPPVALFFAALVLVELVASAVLRHPVYDARETWASLGVGIGGLAVGLAVKGLSFAMLVALYRYRLLDLGDGVLAWVLLFFVEDLRYWLLHLLHHKVRVLWAAHVPHHTPRHFNVTNSLRLSWLVPLTGLPLLAVMPLLGFHPVMVLTMQSASLLYQVTTHTQLVGRLGVLEWVLLTPSHHRVHHAEQIELRDRNFGGVLIVWDRLFGTFAPEPRALSYGIGRDVGTNPVHIALGELVEVGRDAVRPGSLRERLTRLVRWGPSAAPSIPKRPEP